MKVQKYISFFIRPSFTFNEIKKGYLLKNGLVIWAAYSALFFSTAFLMNKEIQRHYIFLPDVSLVVNLLFSIAVNISLIIVIATITNLVSKILGATSQFQNIFTSYLFMGLISIAFIPVQLIISLFGILDSLYYGVLFLPFIWQIIISFIAIKVLYGFSIRKSIIAGGMAWAASLLLLILVLIPVAYLDLLESHIDKGDRSRQVLDYDNAIKQYKLAIETDPTNAAGYYKLGRAYYESSLFKKREDDSWYYKAMREYKRALEIDPSFIKAHIGLGLLYQRKGLLDENSDLYERAVKEFKKAIEIKPDSYEPYKKLGTLYIKLGKKGLAIEQFEKALKIKAGDKYEDKKQALRNRTKKIHTYHVPIEKYITSDVKHVDGDAHVHWKIEEPIIFFGMYESEDDILPRLGDVAGVTIRSEFAWHDRDDLSGGVSRPITEQIMKRFNGNLTKWNMGYIKIVNIQIELVEKSVQEEKEEK